MNESTGYIKVTNQDGALVDWEWQGGIVVWISRALLEDAQDGVFSTRTPVIGEMFTVGPFRVKCTDRLLDRDVIVVEKCLEETQE